MRWFLWTVVVWEVIRILGSVMIIHEETDRGTRLVQAWALIFEVVLVGWGLMVLASLDY